MARYWLVKTEVDVYPLSQLKRDKVTQWTDVRNYQARNYLREMAVGDKVFVYHTNEKPTAIVGVATVSKIAYVDPHQFDSKSEYFDAKATPESPRWFAPDLKFSSEFSTPIPLEVLKKEKDLQAMMHFTNGRLSVQPMTSAEYSRIIELSKKAKRKS